MSTLFQDLKFGLRMLAKNPGFTAVAVLTLALGLAAVNTIFAVVNTILLRPLDFPDSERIFSLSQTVPVIKSGPMVASLAEFQLWEKSGLFEHAAAFGRAGYTRIGTGRAERLIGVSVTPDFFRVFGVQPFLGRGFEAEDATPGHDNVIILSHQLWMSSFGGDRGIVGRSILMSEGPMTVIGVMPPRFDFPRLADVRTIMFWAPDQTQFWTPLTITQAVVERLNYYVLGRLKDGVTPQRAAEQFRASAVQDFRRQQLKFPAYRDTFERLIATLAVNLVPLRDSMSWDVRGTLWMLLVAVALLLVLVLSNLGNLLITRTANRLRQYVVCQALGATRWQLLRQSCVEQALLTSAAAAISVVLTLWGLSIIRTVAAARLPRMYDLSLDTRVAALMVILSFTVAMVFGALPLVVLRNSMIGSVLQSESRSSTGDRRTNLLKSCLMVAEIGGSMVLLVGAGLLIQSFANVMRVNPGFDPHNLVCITSSPNPKIYQSNAKQLAHVRELLDAFRSIPGVESAGVVSFPPLSGETDVYGVRAVGKPSASATGEEAAECRIVDSRYFNTMRIPLISGRGFREDEPAGFAIVNRKMAQRLWPGEDAVGKQFTPATDPPVTVIGVVGDIHSGSLESEPRLQYYLPLAANPSWADKFMIRTRIDPAAVVPLAQQVVWKLDSEQAVTHPQIMERLLESVTLERRFQTGLVAGFAAATLLLASVGLFGIASLSVVRRTREFGIRLALGAQGSDLLWMELSRTLMIAGAGLACGVAASLALGRTVAGFLYGVTAWSPAVYGAAVVTLMVPAFVAAWIPARRATKVDPMVALRYE
jgi:putative ABC transport system permease protein